MATTRRMGSIDSAMGESMLDAAEEILKEEGYAALTSRRIAEYVGIKQRLLYYYFHTMDEVVRETFRRLSKRELARLESAIASDRPLHEVWEVCVNTSDSRLVSEFVALANRSEGLREEVVHFIEESRAMQNRALKRAMSNNDAMSDYPSAEVVAFIGTSLALALNREASLGINKSHAQVKKAIEQFFNALEP